MKITTTDSKTPKVRPYPKLMISTGYNQIVLMESYGSGTVVDPGASRSNVAYSSDEWAMAVFEDYEGTITLENDNVY